MRFVTVMENNMEVAAVLYKGRVITIHQLNSKTGLNWAPTLFDMINKEEVKSFSNWFKALNPSSIQEMLTACPLTDEVNFGPLYRYPRKIWGIGLNYVDHASDLSEKAPTIAPASFMKPDTTIIGPRENIVIPYQSERTTAEAELGIVIGKTCKNVSQEDAMNVVAGFTTVIDMTAEDILQLNPRYLTRAKSFDSFFSFGPELVTPDEILQLHELSVSTIINGKVHRKNQVKNMTFLPEFLVSFHSKVMTLCPGDIISTGTPGAAVIRHGDVVACHIDGFSELSNSVIDSKQNLGGR